MFSIDLRDGPLNWSEHILKFYAPWYYFSILYDVVVVPAVTCQGAAYRVLKVILGLDLASWYWSNSMEPQKTWYENSKLTQLTQLSQLDLLENKQLTKNL